MTSVYLPPLPRSTPLLPCGIPLDLLGKLAFHYQIVYGIMLDMKTFCKYNQLQVVIPYLFFSVSKIRKYQEKYALLRLNIKHQGVKDFTLVSQKVGLCEGKLNGHETDPC